MPGVADTGAELLPAQARVLARGLDDRADMTFSPAPSPDSLTAPARTYVQRFSSTPRGARLARRLAAHQLHAWGVPYGSVDSDTAALVVAELAANAVTHGRVPGRDFELALSLSPELLRIELSDARSERRPPYPGALPPPRPLAEAGRGLHLVEALAARWEVRDRMPGKTVVAELELPG